jgi:hypothetical protein
LEDKLARVTKEKGAESQQLQRNLATATDKAVSVFPDSGEREQELKL